MKRIAPVLLLALLACDSTSTDRTTPTGPSAVTSSAAIGPLGAEVQCDDICKGGNAWWDLKFDIFGDANFDQCDVRVYTVDTRGQRHFFAAAKTGVPELEGTDFNFFAVGIAPPDSMRDYIGAGYPANYGFTMFAFDVYDPAHRVLIGTVMQGSDITLTSNLLPHACQGIKPRTGCGYACCPANIVASAAQVSGVWSWQIAGNFYTGPCVNPTLRLKAYVVAPDGKAQIFARGDAEPTDPYGGHAFTLTGVAPTLAVASLPAQWVPQFVIDVTSNGTPVGQFAFDAPNPLTPNTK
jgi:hypothetical protein